MNVKKLQNKLHLNWVAVLILIIVFGATTTRKIDNSFNK